MAAYSNLDWTASDRIEADSIRENAVNLCVAYRSTRQKALREISNVASRGSRVLEEDPSASDHHATTLGDFLSRVATVNSLGLDLALFDHF